MGFKKVMPSNSPSLSYSHGARCHDTREKGRGFNDNNWSLHLDFFLNLSPWTPLNLMNALGLSLSAKRAEFQKGPWGKK